MEERDGQDEPGASGPEQGIIEDRRNLSSTDRIYRALKTLCLFLLFVAKGLEGAVVGPTLIDLSQLTGCNYEQLSRSLAAKYAGLILGSFVVGALTDRFARHRDGLLVVNLVVLGGGLAALPWMRNLWELAAAFLLQGLGHGGLSATSNVVIVKLWGENAPGPMQLIHMGYGIGTMVAPLIAKPFLSQQHPNITVNNLYHNATTSSTSLIYIPYSIVAGWAGFVGLIFLLFYCFPRETCQEDSPGMPSQRKSLCEVITPQVCRSRQSIHRVVLFILLFFVYITLVGKDMVLGLFLFTIAVESKLHFTKSEASYWYTAFFACYSLGRLVSSGLAFFITPSILLFAEVILTIGVTVGLAFVGLQSAVYFWILSLLFNLFVSPMWPGGISWMSSYIEVTGMTLSVLVLGTGMAGLIFPWLAGYLYQNGGAEDVIYLSLGASGVLLITLTLAQIYMKCYANQINEQLNESEDRHEEVDERTPLIN